MEKINIVGVPEHFNYPWVKLVNEQPFLENDVKLIWEDESRGSGAMNHAIREGDAALGVILTESFVKDKVEGNTGKIIGFHVNSPLRWGIHVSAHSKIQTVDELKNIPFLISRMGSGSHLMAYLLAKENGWATEEMDFEIIGNLEGAIKALKKTTPKAFLWEKYTTKPLVDKGWFRRIGELPTPWPCFVIVASEKSLRDHPEVIKTVRDKLYKNNGTCMAKQPDLIRAISQNYQLNEVDVADWIGQTSWAIDERIKKSSLTKTMETLFDLGLIKKKIKVEELVDENLVIWE